LLRKQQAIPHDIEAERGYIGCRLYRADDERLDPGLHLFDELRRKLALTIDAVRHAGEWQTPARNHVGDELHAARANSELVAYQVLKAGLWTDDCRDPRHELLECRDVAAGQPSMISHFVDRLIKAHLQRVAIETHERRLRAARSGDLDAALEGTGLSVDAPDVVNVQPWPEPRPLPDALPAVQAFDPSILPAALGPWIEDIAERIQCPPDFPAVAAMIVAAGLVGRRIGIRPKQHDDWLVVPNLWGAVIGRPGLMKTPAITEPLNVLKRLEIAAKDEFVSLQSAHQAAELGFVGKLR